MDQINSNSYYNPARLFQNQAAPQQKAGSPAIGSSSASEMINGRKEQSPVSDFSTMFDDDALLKLQSNLEAIAQMAEKSLKQIDS